MTTATGTFKIAFGDEDAYHEAEGEPKLTRASGTQRFSGGIEGDGTVEWLMCYLPDGAASFVGLQRIAGSIGDRTGSFVMGAAGDHDGKRSKATWMIIDGSGTGDLSGIRGRGSFEAPGGPEGSYTLEYEIG